MPKVGDGTGMSGGGSEMQGDENLDNAKPENTTKPYTSYRDGRGPELVSGGNRKTPIGGGGSKSSKS
jgi:hypothetical protein